jgi:hypothetical protein
VSSEALIGGLTVVEMVLLALLALNLWRTGLFRTYHALFYYSLIELCRTAATVGISPYTKLYGYIYFLTQPVIWILYALMTLEMYQTALSSFPSIASTSRRVISWWLVGALVLAVASLALGTSTDASWPILETFLVVGRVINTSLFLFVIGLAATLFWFPVPLSRNALVNASAFTFFFAACTGAMLGRNIIGPEFRSLASTALLTASIATIVVWRLFLTPEGEENRIYSGFHRDKETAERLIGQLETLNRTLAGTIQK